MLLEINHRDAIPPDKYKVGESSLGGNDEGRQGSAGGGVGGDVGEGGGEGAGGLTFSDNPTVEKKYIETCCEHTCKHAVNIYVNML